MAGSITKTSPPLDHAGTHGHESERLLARGSSDSAGLRRKHGEKLLRCKRMAAGIAPMGLPPAAHPGRTLHPGSAHNQEEDVGLAAASAALVARPSQSLGVITWQLPCSPSDEETV